MPSDGITFVDVFEIPTAELDEFLEQWRERAQLMRRAPGFRHLLSAAGGRTSVERRERDEPSHPFSQSRTIAG